jgi:hypothetical protein
MLSWFEMNVHFHLIYQILIMVQLFCLQVVKLKAMLFNYLTAKLIGGDNFSILVTLFMSSRLNCKFTITIIFIVSCRLNPATICWRCNLLITRLLLGSLTSCLNACVFHQRHVHISSLLYILKLKL